MGRKKVRVFFHSLTPFPPPPPSPFFLSRAYSLGTFSLAPALHWLPNSIWRPKHSIRECVHSFAKKTPALPARSCSEHWSLGDVPDSTEKCHTEIPHGLGFVTKLRRCFNSCRTQGMYTEDPQLTTCLKCDLNTT